MALDFAEFFMALEERFGIELGGAEIERAATVPASAQGYPQTTSAELWAAFMRSPYDHPNIPNVSFAGYGFSERPLPQPRLATRVRAAAEAGAPRFYLEPPTADRVVEVVADAGFWVQTTVRMAQGQSTSRAALDWPGLSLRQRANLARSVATTRDRDDLRTAAASLDAVGEPDLAARYRAQAGGEP